MAQWCHRSAAISQEEHVLREMRHPPLLNEVFTTQILPYKDPDVEVLVEQWAGFEWRGVRRGRA
jgi:hypothetical protein